MAGDGGRVTQGDEVDEDYILYTKKMYTGFQQSPWPAVYCYSSQPVISDGLPNYLFRNQNEKRSKESQR